jgi:hypothetical protein
MTLESATHARELFENHLGRRPPVGVETAEVYPPGGRERPMFLRKVHVRPAKKDWDSLVLVRR